MWTVAVERARRGSAPVACPVPMLDQSPATDEKAARRLVGGLLALDVLTIALLVVASGLLLSLVLW
jgi:hypothetical protein